MMGIKYQLLFLFASVRYAAYQELPGFLLNPTIHGPERVNINDTETYSCVALTSTSSIIYSLYREQTLVEAKNVSKPNAANFSVSFHSESDAGSYKCKAESADGDQVKYSESIDVTVLAPVLGIRINSIPDPPLLKVNSKLTLNCFIKQGSNVTYQWYFNEQELLPSPSVRINQSSLVIDNVNFNDTGNYKCTASNEFNMETFRISSSSIEVTVKIPVSNPEISAKIAFIIQGLVYTSVSCLSQKGNLPIIYTLYRDSRFMGNYTAQSRRRGQFVVPVKYSGRLGIFKCKAMNGFESKYSQGVTIDLAVNMTSDPDPPIPGHNFTLNCSVVYEHQGPYTWYIVRPGGNRTENTIKNQLIVTSTEPGRYYCSVNEQISNWIEVPGQDSSLQPVTLAVSIAVVVLLVLALGLICYCIAHKADRFSIA